MKYVLTGGAGHITKPAAEKLLAAGHEVVIIGRHAANLQELVQKGATAAIGSVEDATFVTNTFKGADAVYLMIPPNFNPGGGWRNFQNKVADVFVEAITTTGVKNAVVLSSVGAHMGEGAGPVDGLADLEKKLGALSNVNLKFLRPSYFMYNLFGMIPLIQQQQIMGSNFGGTGEKLVLAHTDDIAAVLADELLHLDFTGHSSRYIASDEREPEEIAEVLSKAIGKPGIPWVVFTDEQSLNGMLQAGLPQQLAQGYMELGRGLRTGEVQRDYWKNRPEPGRTRLEDFAIAFAAAYEAEQAKK